MTWYIDDTTKAAYVLSSDGHDQRRILSDVDGDIRSLGWSPDGLRLVFVVRDDERPGGAIWTAAADGTGAALFYDGLDDGCVDVFHPIWSPDGSALSLVCYGERDATLAVLNIDLMQLTRLATYPWPDFLDGAARWSNDGRTLAYAVLQWDPTDTYVTGSRLATIAADGSGEPEYLSDYDSFYSSPDWSPDDQRLVFNSYDLGNMRNETSNLYLSNVDGTDVEELTVAADVGVERVANGVWDPGGARIWVAVVDDHESSFHPGWVDPDTGHLTTLPTVGVGVEPQP
jgi:Tol biopolymer transport system component